MAKEFWEDDAPAETSVPAPTGGDFWLSDAPADAAPDTGDESSRLAARYPAPPSLGLADVRANEAAQSSRFVRNDPATQAPAEKPVSVLQTVGMDQSKPWSFADASRTRRAIEDMPQRRPEASITETPLATQIGMDARKVVTNPAARGVMAGLSGLGQVIPGAVQAGADLVGADGVSSAAGRVARTGRQLADPLAPAGGSDKLVFDIANSITQTAPTLLVGMAGGPAMKALFAQSAAQEYTTGTAAGLDGGTAAARAGIMAGAEVLGERFGFGEQLQILKGMIGKVPVEELAPVFARQIMKEIPGEQLTTLIQFLGDKYGPGAQNPEASLANYLTQAGDTLKVTIGQTAVMGGGPVVLNKVREGLAKPIDRKPQIEALRKAGDETAAALVEQRQQKEQATYTTERETQAVAQINPDLAQRYREVRMTGAKTGDAVVQTAARWNFEQAAQMAGLTPKAQEAIAAKLADIPPEKAATFVQKAITGMVNAGQAQPFEGMDSLAQTIETQRDQMLDSVLGVMDDINQLEAQQDATQDTTATETQAVDAGAAAPNAVGNDPALGGTEPGPALIDNNDVQVTPELDAVHAAATSPLNDLPEPTEAQKKAGNYKVGKIRMSGMDISIENPQGSERRGVDPDGKEWTTPMRDHYGYFKGTTAADGDKLDVFIKPGTPQDYDGQVFVVDQINPSTGKFDEAKVVFGAADQTEAEAIYRRNYSADWKGFGAITQLPMPAFKAWAKSNATRKPLGVLPTRNVQDAPQGTGTEAQAAPGEARPAEGGNAAAAAGVPAAIGVGDVQADGVDAPSAGMPDPDQQRRDYMAAEKKRAAKRATLTNRERDKNPLREFLGRHGVSMDLAKEFAPGIKERRKAMVAGHGPIFRKVGKNIDMLAEAAAEEGFTATEDADALYELIARVFRGERVALLYAEGVAESEMEARMQAMQEDAPEFDDFLNSPADNALAPLTDDELAATGYAGASDAIKAEVEALVSMAESMGIDTETLWEDAARATADQPEQAYYEQAQRILTQAIGEGSGSRSDGAPVEPGAQQREEAQPRGDADRGQGDGGQGQQGVTLESRPDGTLSVKGDTKALRERLTAAGIPVRSILPSANGVVVGKTQAEKAREVLESPALTAPTRSDIEAQQDRAEQADKLDERAQVKRESELGDSTFMTGFTGDGRQDDTGNLFAMEPGPEYSQPYETDLFGEALPASNRAAAKAARPDRVRGDAQPAATVQSDTPATAGEYSAKTVVGTEVRRKLGAPRINSFADLAQATQYLYRSAVERFDAIVTDNDGKPLAVVGGFKGAVSQTAIYPGTIIGEAVRVPGAAKIWFSHNHPSGTAKLSQADEMLNKTLGDALSGSGIEPMGLIAVAGKQYAASDATTGDIKPAEGPTEVPVIERDLIPSNADAVLVDSPIVAKSVAKTYYARSNEPGIILLDSQNRVSAWIPIPPNMRGYLRYEDGLNAIYRAVSESNAAAAIIAHGGELDAKPFGGRPTTSSQNIMAALRKVDVRPLDTINVETLMSQAEQGLAIDSGPLFSIAEEAPTFYSELARQIEKSPMNAGQPGAWTQYLDALAKRGAVKADEVEWTGLREWLNLQPGKVTKAQIAEFLDANGVQVTETVLSDNGTTDLPPGWLLREATENDEVEDRWVLVDEDGEVRGSGSTSADAMADGWDADSAADAPTKYSNYTLPGGSNYREVLLTLPVNFLQKDYKAAGEEWDRLVADPKSTPDQVRDAERRMKQALGRKYSSSHWAEDNVLAHIRVNDRTAVSDAFQVRNKRSGNPGQAFDTMAEADASINTYPETIRKNLEVVKTTASKRVLFVEEIQSDWGQDGKKKGFKDPAMSDEDVMRLLDDAGYSAKSNGINWVVTSKDGAPVPNRLAGGSDKVQFANSLPQVAQMVLGRRDLMPSIGAVPRAPFIGNTDKWLSLSLKRILKMAVDGGYDRVAFVNGEQSAERYDLSKHIDSVDVRKVDGGKLMVYANKNNQQVLTKMTAPESLDEVIGKDLAQRVLQDIEAGKPTQYSGLDLKTGGEGMKSFYDKIVPAAVKDVLKKVGGGAMEAVSIPVEMDGITSAGQVEPVEVGQNRWVLIGPNGERANMMTYGSKAEAQQDAAESTPNTKKLTQPGFTITDSMREKVAGGLPLFSVDDAGKAGDTQPNGTPAQAITAAQRAAVQRLERVIRTQRGDPAYVLEPVEQVAGAGREFAFARNIVREAFGIDVIPVRQTGKRVFNGAQVDDHLMIDVRTVKPAMVVMGHELLHQLRRDDPQLYSFLKVQIERLLNDGATDAYGKSLRERYAALGLKELSDDTVSEELLADIVGDQFGQREFWDAMDKKAPGRIASLARKVLEFFDKLLDIGRQKFPFETDRYLSDLKAAREVVAGVLAEYSGDKTGRSAAQSDPKLAVAYHGTPHRFDKFTTEKIGTGEGAQAYGWGLYFAGRKEIAEHYRKTLSEDKYYIEDKPVDETNPLHVAAATIEYAGSASEAETILAKEMTASYNTPDMRDVYARALQAIQDGERIPDARRRAGSLYEVEIPEDTEMILWDKPLNEQPERVREALKQIASTMPGRWETGAMGERKFVEQGRNIMLALDSGTITGEQLYTSLAEQYSKPEKAPGWGSVSTDSDGRSWSGQQAASLALAEAGVRGIKYMDGVSRNKALRDVKREFLEELPEDADFDEVMELVGTGAFSPKNDDVIKALAADDWLGFDYPSQALSAALSGKLGNYDASPALIQAVAATQDDSTYNYVVFSGDDVAIQQMHYSIAEKTPASVAAERATEAPTVQTEMFQPGFWDVPQETRLDKVIFELQDGRIDLKRVQETIAKSNAIPEKFDARLAETLYPGRVAVRSERFLNDEAKPLLDAMARNNVTMDELADYLHARHAEERNKQIAKVNPDMPDGGAGKNSKGVLMTTQAAKQHIAGLSDSKRMVLDAMAKRVDTITAGTNKLLVDEGLEKQETIDAWTGAYQKYVPLFRDEAENGNPHPTGGGMSVRGSSSKRATGSTKKATNILAHVLMQREAAITRAEKNRVAVALYGLALSNPNPDFWTTIKPSMSPKAIGQELQRMGVDPTIAEAGMQGVPTIKTVDPTLGRVVSRPNPIYKSMPGAIVLKVNGDDRVLMVNTNDPRGLRMAENLKNLDGLTRLDIAGSAVGKATRWLASVNTQYNPAFGLVNLTRDTLGGAINLSSTKLRGKTMKVLALTPGALKGIGLELSGKNGGEWGRLFRQFQADGGQTGFREQFKDANDRAKALEAELKAMEKAGKLTATKVADKVLGALDIFNTTLENAVRLAAYREALLEGMSRPEAARLGRELTVDFNRKGRTGRELGPLYAFFNASVQGTARTLQTLAGPDGAKIIAGGVSLGVLQAMMLLAAGYDDDEIPEFVKTRALIIPLGKNEEGEKKYLTIPLPLGLHVLPNTGRVLAELTLDGGKDIGAKSFAAVGEIAGAFNPLGGGNVFTTDGALRTVAPTVVDPIIEIGFNKNFAGTPIEREGYGNDPRPGFERAREGTLRAPTGQAYLEVSRILNKLSGGDEYEAGKVSPTPEFLRYLAQVVGGGLLREIEKTVNTSIDLAKGNDTKPTGYPVFGRFYGQTDDESVQRGRYYDNLAAIEKAEKLVKAAEKKGDLDAADRIEQARPEALLKKEKNRAVRDLRELNQEAMQTVGDREELRMLDEERTEVMRELNEAAADVDKPRKDATLGAEMRRGLGLADANP